ncbi:hypothetical protein ZYGR_0AS00840 [Zygosaccharomyces rouxii]|uniref:superoxide dismutase n=1 Tax=Zygosaccharomyces rouxii TaxID=4956 RepID=A0A1Q3AGH5_ZYGRO|nr:hypothetical protein ZYGR_0AS00840 [Zygosaccharomyces rouxii]
MRLTSAIINLLALTLCVFAAAAPEVMDSPQNVKYEANFHEGVEGSIKFKANSEGQVKVNFKLHGFPEEGAPFLYHVHEKPVPSNGSCDAALGHLNPYNGSPDATDDADKEVGDLSGKHGNITTNPFKTCYVDPYLSLNKTDPAFIGNLSIVVHFANETRLACANITRIK